MSKRGGNRKHSVEAIQNALAMIQKGENPFRASKEAGIARTTLLYHLEKLPSDAFPTGINPVIEHIQQQIEMLYWKTKLRLIKTMFHKARKTDEKGSTAMWETLSKNPPRSPISSKPVKPVLNDGTVDDQVSFTEFIIARKGVKGAVESGGKNSLSEASADSRPAIPTIVEGTIKASEKGD